MKKMILATLIAATPSVAAAPFQDTVAIDRAVASFAGRAIGEDGGARTTVDPRLRLAACPMVSLAWHTDRHDAVVVACTGPEWRIFVPIRFAGAPTPTANAPGDAAPVAARLAPVIKRGDPVMIAASSAGFSITREGIAMGDAAPGAHFLVKCDDAKNPVQAIAIESGRATLPGWAE